MGNYLEYIVKTNCLLVLFFLVYYIFLKKETYFQYNRWFLVSGLLASIICPSVILKKVVWIEKPIFDENLTKLTLQEIEPIIVTTAITNPENIIIMDWNLVFVVMYFVVSSLLFMKLLLELYSYKMLIKNKVSVQKNGINTIETADNISPFSFFKTIVINPNLYSKLELKAIIAHEKVHVQQYHSVDVLVSKIYTIVFWYNPIIWIYRKYIIQNLEYIADNKATENNNDLKTYQYTLLKYTTNLRCVALTNPFYQSLIKKRIVMLNKKPSANANKIKLAIIVPLLAIFIWQFQTKIVAQEKLLTIQSPVQNAKIEIEITKNTTDAYMNEQSKKLKNDKNIELKFSKVKRNKKLEIIAIKVVLDDNQGSESEHEIESDKPINNFLIVYDVTLGKSEIGFYTAKYKDSKRVSLSSNYDEDVAVKAAIAVEMPEPFTPPLPPTPPTPPSFGNYQKMFGNMPKSPTPPSNPNDKLAMEKFEKAIKEFERKMENYEKNVNETQKISDTDMGIYEKKMQEYEKVMQNYETKMEDYQQKLEAYVDEINFKYSSIQNDSIDIDNKARVDNGYFREKNLNERRKIINERRKIINERKRILKERKKILTE